MKQKWVMDDNVIGIYHLCIISSKIPDLILLNFKFAKSDKIFTYKFMTHWSMFQQFTSGMIGNTIQELLSSTLVFDCA